MNGKVPNSVDGSALKSVYENRDGSVGQYKDADSPEDTSEYDTGEDSSEE